MCRLRNRLWPILCLLAVGTGCNHGRVYHSYQPVGPDGWDRTDTLVFQLPHIPDSMAMLDLSLCLRIFPQLWWRQVAVGVEYRLSRPDTLFRDTVLVTLSDSAGSRSLARNPLLQYRHPMASFSADRLQGARLRVFHLMRSETLPRVSDVGIRVERRQD